MVNSKPAQFLKQPIEEWSSIKLYFTMMLDLALPLYRSLHSKN